MAQVNTGLGWSAKEDWLKQYSGRLGYVAVLGGPDFPNQPLLPCNNSGSDVVEVGIKIAHDNNANADLYIAAYYGMTDELFGWYNNNGTITPAVLRPGDNICAIFGVWVNSITGQTLSGRIYQGSSSYSAQYDLTYLNVGFAGGTPDIKYGHEFSSLTDILSSVQRYTIDYNKLNPGYSVACVATWYTIDGTEMKSPILISTVPLNTVITSDGTTPSANMQTFDFLYQGTRFYMTLITGIEGTLESVVTNADLRQFGAAMPSKVFLLIADESFANIIITESQNPYDENAEEEGGGGDDPEDDPVEEQTNPLPSVAGLGFCTVYVPSQMELLAMSSYLWSGNFDVDQVIKLFSNPLDSIIGLSAVPVDLVGTSEQIYLGGVALTGVTMPRYTGRTAVKVDMGTVTIGERYGAYLDYDPYTEFAIYVPFVGIKNLKADDIMGKTLSLMYDIDILTGACVAYLRPAGGSVLYEWAGQCSQQIPVTSANWDNIFRNAMTAASTLGTSLFAPASAPVLAGAVASAATQAIAAKPRVDRSGSLTGVSGWLGQLRPYIIRTIPEAYIPADQNRFIGYPAYITVSIASITGYNEVASVHLEGIPATGNELAEIESLLKGGVIF